MNNGIMCSSSATIYFNLSMLLKENFKFVDNLESLVNIACTLYSTIHCTGARLYSVLYSTLYSAHARRQDLSVEQKCLIASTEQIPRKIIANLIVWRVIPILFNLLKF